MSDLYNASIMINRRLTETLFFLNVKTDFEIPDFKPGQFTTLGLSIQGKMVKRAYSIASSPSNKKHLEFYIALVEDGRLTPELSELKTGDRLFVGPRFVGKFTFDRISGNKDLLLVSTGTGVAPFLSMIRTHLKGTSQRKIILLQGARFSYELGFYSELCFWEKRYKNFLYIPAVSRPQEDPNWGGINGRVTQVIQSEEFMKKVGKTMSPDAFEILLCGNPDMIEEMAEYFIQRGFNQESKKGPVNIHFEKYW